MKRFAVCVSLLLLCLPALGAQLGHKGREMVWIPDHTFTVAGHGPTSTAMLVYQRGRGILSCFSAAPATLGLIGNYESIMSPAGLYHCTDGQDALLALAYQKQLLRNWALPSGASAASCQSAASVRLPTTEDVIDASSSARTSVTSQHKCSYEQRLPDSKCFDDATWDAGDASVEEAYFWDWYSMEVGGCMAQCNAALAATLRLCALIPPPVQEACMVGAAAIYVACIAGC